MSNFPIFLAHSKAGRLVFKRPDIVSKYLTRVDGKELEVIIRSAKSKRSIQQNNYWWAVPVEIMADYMGEERTATHYALLGECFGYHWSDHLKRDVPNKGSSSALTTEEFSQLIEWCPPWALENFNVQIPLPNECDYEV